MSMRPFSYHQAPHTRRHGPQGYTDYTSYKDWLRDEFIFKCVYCLNRETWHFGLSTFGVDHLLSRSSRPDLACDYANLVYACNDCNSFKGDSDGAPDPCNHGYTLLLRINPDGTIEGLNSKGTKLISVLALDRPTLTEWRERWIKSYGELIRRPDTPQKSDLRRRFFGFPIDLPDLRALRPPSNTRPSGLQSCCYVLKSKGDLPDYCE